MRGHLHASHTHNGNNGYLGLSIERRVPDKCDRQQPDGEVADCTHHMEKIDHPNQKVLIETCTLSRGFIPKGRNGLALKHNSKHDDDAHSDSSSHDAVENPGMYSANRYAE